jgi:flagellar protein FliO/FliZ
MELFGGVPDAVRFIVAFVLVLGLIGMGAWVWRRFGGGPLQAAPRGRQPRLAVIDVAAVDARRRLLLIRRDNTEHLVMIGGPTDVLIEANIARSGAAQNPCDPRSNPLGDIPTRVPAATDGPGWMPTEPTMRSPRPLESSLPQAAEAEPRETSRTPPRETAPSEPAAPGLRSEPAFRAAPAAPVERFRPDYDSDEIGAPALTPAAMAAELHAAMPPEPRRQTVHAVPPPPPPPGYEPAFQPAPIAERRSPMARLAPEASASERIPEPRRVAARSMSPPAYEPSSEPEPEPEPPWVPQSTPPPAAPPAPMPAVALAPAIHDPGPPAVRHSPVFQSAGMAEAKRVPPPAPAPPPRPSQSDENLAEMAQRLEAALRRPLKPVEPAPAAAPPPPPVRVASPAPAPSPAARASVYFEPPTRGPATRSQDGGQAPMLKVVPAQGKAPSLEEEMASLLGCSTGKT